MLSPQTHKEGEADLREVLSRRESNNSPDTPAEENMNAGLSSSVQGISQTLQQMNQIDRLESVVRLMEMTQKLHEKRDWKNKNRIAKVIEKPLKSTSSKKAKTIVPYPRK